MQPPLMLTDYPGDNEILSRMVVDIRSRLFAAAREANFKRTGEAEFKLQMELQQWVSKITFDEVLPVRIVWAEEKVPSIQWVSPYLDGSLCDRIKSDYKIELMKRPFCGLNLHQWDFSRVAQPPVCKECSYPYAPPTIQRLNGGWDTVHLRYELADWVAMNRIDWHCKGKLYWQTMFERAEKEAIVVRPLGVKNETKVVEVLKQMRYDKRLEAVMFDTSDPIKSYGPVIGAMLWREAGKLSKDLDYIDNYRFAKKDKRGHMRQFWKASHRGCCGSVNEEYSGYMIGFNYGH